MTLIQSLLKGQNKVRFTFDKVVGDCLNLRELDVILHNMDRCAKLYQNDESCNRVFENEMIIERQNENLFISVKAKILTALLNSGLLKEDIIYNANRLKNILEDEICNPDIEVEKAFKINKAYLVAKIITENINNFNIEKTL
ncbi:MAG: hypothetical protein J6Q15_02305 [Clostridia bacterium]|nr:hypothetical protein [Clostridia bacterium]